MSDIWSGTNEKLLDLLKFCLVCLAGPAVNINTESNRSHIFQAEDGRTD